MHENPLMNNPLNDFNSMTFIEVEAGTKVFSDDATQVLTVTEKEAVVRGGRVYITSNHMELLKAKMSQFQQG